MPTSFPRTTRRSFLKGLTVTTASGLVLPNLLLRADETPAGKKLGIACIGVGGKGFSDMEAAAQDNEIVAICDVDAKNLAKAAEKFPQARQYRDFRKMLDEVASIDAVTVSTPDHAHYPAAMHAMGLGKHVCVQKPLVNTLWEGREMHRLAKKKGLITQMGNQGHTFDDNRVFKEWMMAGVIGKVQEIHVWTNRPIWSQGSKVSMKPGEVPSHLDWPLWLAATPEHAYSPDIHPFAWRGFVEWGAGAIGDMGCHNIDPIFWGLELGIPDRVEAVSEELTDIAWPRSAKIKYHWKNVPKHGPITMTWYEGKNADDSRNLPEAFPELEGKKISDTGFYIRGSEGLIYNQGDQCKNPQILPAQRSQDFLASPPAKSLERSPTAGNPQREWTLAIKQGKPFPFMSQFDYAVPLTELCLLGALAMRVGEPIEWNSEKFEVVGKPGAAKFLKRGAYRPGWEYKS